ncbi:hypothetical protein ACFVVU_03790 [Kitasatospora sp. NPDC057965]|uniref:hypothetical protein n=1 Tax=Kitasatospora sp. NPDC057965 TaxID=3346291 RepID=UPI0036D9B114
MSTPPEGAVAPAPATAVLPVARPGLPPELPPSPYRSMSDAARSALWRRRLHEAEAGLTTFLVSRRDEVHPTDWFALQSAVSADLPEERSAGAPEWQRVFFRGKALTERFLVSRYGEPVNRYDQSSARERLLRLIDTAPEPHAATAAGTAPEEARQ